MIEIPQSTQRKEVLAMDEKKKPDELKYDEASSHFEAENLNKYDELELKEKNLVISEFEKEYVDPITEEVKNAKDLPGYDEEEVKKHNPDELLKKETES